ncbi:Uncharacterised protein [Mycobacterium tuberculosis]|nr:Uncharacterised protein [Mycobacterium tuberculosis]
MTPPLAIAPSPGAHPHLQDHRVVHAGAVVDALDVVPVHLGIEAKGRRPQSARMQEQPPGLSEGDEVAHDRPEQQDRQHAPHEGPPSAGGRCEDGERQRRGDDRYQRRHRHQLGTRDENSFWDRGARQTDALCGGTTAGERGQPQRQRDHPPPRRNGDEHTPHRCHGRGVLEVHPGAQQGRSCSEDTVQDDDDHPQRPPEGVLGKAAQHRFRLGHPAARRASVAVRSLAP